MGTKERRQRERQEVREKILEAARELFVSEGYEAVTMRKIADRIEYSPTAIYFHFKDKETVLRELCEEDFLALAAELGTIARIADPIARLRATGLAYARFGVEHPNHYRLMFMTPHPVPAPEDLAIEKGNPDEDSYAFLRAIIEEGLAQGRFRPDVTDPDLVAQTLWAGLHGVVSLQITKADDPWCEWKPMERRAEAMLDVLLRGLLRAPAAGEE